MDKKKLGAWWNQTRVRTEFALGYKTKLGSSNASSQAYEIGYLFISYETTYKREWTDWKFRTLHSFYGLSLIDKLPKLRGIATTRSTKNFIRFEKKKSKTGNSGDSYIYRNTNTLAFYPVKCFPQTPTWSDLPRLAEEGKIYFKCYENQKQNRRALRLGTKWVKHEDLENEEGLFITYVNTSHNRDIKVPKPKKIKKLVKKGFKKQFVKYQIGSTVRLKRLTEC